MDPYQTYRDMFAAMESDDFETARELALALKEWFARGGFTPHQVTREAMHELLASVLRRTAGDELVPVFSLTCRDCDAGEEIESEEQAIEQGWIRIEAAFDLPMANYCGLCPDCREVEKK